MARIDLKLCTIQIQDGSNPVNALFLKIGSGNLQWTEKQDIVYVKDRGLLGTVRRGDQQPVDLKFDLIYEFLEGVSDVTPEDFLKRRNNASAYKTAGADPCQPFAVKMILTQDQSCPGTPDIETVIFTEFRFESISHDLRNGMLAVAGKCNVQTATVIRS